MNEDCFVRQYSSDGWTFRFFLEEGMAGTRLDGAAEIYRGGVMQSCIVSPSQPLNREQVLQWLMHLCTDWVADADDGAAARRACNS